jgi:TPR repeat protein
MRGAALALGLVLVLALGAPAAAQTAPQVDLRLVEAIGWYTGTRGLVDDARARMLIETSAFEGNVLARMWLARLYSRGRAGYPRDEARARAIAEPLVDAVRRQAMAGTTEAVFLIGTAHDEGLGVAEDPASAFEWFAKAAAAGHTLAEHNLGNAYAAGRGVTADPVQAVSWWLKAAIKGDAVPQLRLGEAYEAGRGATKNLDEARRWYGEAARRGNAAAAAALKRLTGPA